RILLGDDLSAHLRTLLRSRRVQVPLVVDGIAVLGMDRVAPSIDPRVRRERMRTRPRRVGVAAERVVASLGAAGIERGRHERPAREGNGSAPQQAEEGPPAGPARELLGGPLDLLVQDHRTPATAASSARCRAVSTNPSSCSRLLTVPLARTTPRASSIT